jgi:PAS domain-containing protein
VTEASDEFLRMVGYSREDLEAGRLHWPDLTPPEYLPLDDRAHEEGLRYGEPVRPLKKNTFVKMASGSGFWWPALY